MDPGLSSNLFTIPGFLLIAIVGMSIAGFMRHSLVDVMLLRPYEIMHKRKYHLLVTYGFVHADVGHLLFNAISYFSIAFVLEQTLGPLRFLVVYFGSLVLGTIPTVLRHRNDFDYRALGASGAVSGLFFSGMLYFPMSKVYLMMLPIGIPWFIFSILFVAASYYGSRQTNSAIGHETHLYGALAGLLLTVLLDPHSVSIFYSKIFG